MRQEVWHNLQGPAPGSASQPPPPQEQRHQRGTKLVKCDMSLWGLQIQSIISPRQQAVGTQQEGRWEAGEQASVLGKGSAFQKNLLMRCCAMSIACCGPAREAFPKAQLLLHLLVGCLLLWVH